MDLKEFTVQPNGNGYDVSVVPSQYEADAARPPAGASSRTYQPFDLVLHFPAAFNRTRLWAGTI